MNIFQRKPKEYFLIGCANRYIGRNPPTLRKLLQNCLYYREKNKSVEQSVKLAIQNAMVIWEKMGVPIKRSDHCYEKLLREYKEWQEINKNKHVKSFSKKQGLIKQKRESFISKLDAEFDVKRDPKNETQTSISSNLWDVTDVENFETHQNSGDIRMNLSESEGKNNSFRIFSLNYLCDIF